MTERQQGSSTSTSSRAGRVLILDDDLLTRRTLGRLLTTACYEVRDESLQVSAAIGDAELVIVSLRNADPLHAPVAVLLDRVRDAAAGVPVLVLSDHRRPGMALALFERGFYDHVAAPYDADSILPAVARAIERERLRRGLPGEAKPAVTSLATLEAREIDRALHATAGNVRRAAALLGVGRATLYRRLATLSGAAQTLRAVRGEPAVSAPAGARPF